MVKEIFVYPELSEKVKSLIRASVEGRALRTIFSDEIPATDLAIHLNAADVLFGNPPATLIHQHNKLQFWQLESAGFDQYKDIVIKGTVANMGDYFSRYCAETMMAGILTLYRNLHELIRLQANRQWVGKPIRYTADHLFGKKVVILGAGTIATYIKQMLSGFDCTVLMMARSNPDAALHSREVLLEELKDTNVLINTLPGSAHHFVNDEVFQNMKTGALYATVGRGNTTDEEALRTALQQQRLAGAVLDVTAQEPLPHESAWWSLPNVILTQHSGGGHRGEDEGKTKRFIENLQRFLRDEPIRDVITLNKGY